MLFLIASLIASSVSTLVTCYERQLVFFYQRLKFLIILTPPRSVRSPWNGSFTDLEFLASTVRPRKFKAGVNLDDDKWIVQLPKQQQLIAKLDQE